MKYTKKSMIGKMNKLKKDLEIANADIIGFENDKNYETPVLREYTNIEEAREFVEDVKDSIEYWEEEIEEAEED